MPATTSRYMRDYMEYSTEKRKRRDERTVTATDGRGVIRAQGGGVSRPNLTRKASGRGVTATSIRRRKSIRRSDTSTSITTTAKKTSQTLKSCRSVSEIETLLPRKAASAVRDTNSTSCCHKGSNYHLALERAKKAALADKDQHGQCCASKSCCSQR